MKCLLFSLRSKNDDVVINLHDRLPIPSEGRLAFRGVHYTKGKLPRCCLVKATEHEIKKAWKPLVQFPAEILDLLRMSKARHKISLEDHSDAGGPTFFYDVEFKTWDSTELSEWITAALVSELEKMDPKIRAYTIDRALEHHGKKAMWLVPEYRRQAFADMCKRALKTSIAFKKKLQSLANAAPPASLP